MDLRPWRPLLGMGWILLAAGQSPYGLTMSFGPPTPLGGPPLSKGYGGKMSNVLDLYPEGFASSAGGRPHQSTDGGKTFTAVLGTLNASEYWGTFATYTTPTGHRYAHDWGDVGQNFYTTNATATAVSSNSSRTYTFHNGTLTRVPGGPGVSFKGLPRPPCAAPNNIFTVYAAGHIVLPDGTHLQSGELFWCGAPFSGIRSSLVAFHSVNGYDYEYVGNISTSLDIRTGEGPNEHDLALLPNGDLLCVIRSGAGDMSGGYTEFYKTLSSDGGKTWSKAEAMPGMGCARPHLKQLGNATILTGGRKMMGHMYDRAFDVWMSYDNALTWEHASGSYEHNAKANITGVPLWPESVNSSGWRFEFTSGYVGLVQVGEMSAMVLYDFMIACPQSGCEGDTGTHRRLEQGGESRDDFDFVRHNPPFDFAMRIDIVPKAKPAPTPAAAALLV